MSLLWSYYYVAPTELLLYRSYGADVISPLTGLILKEYNKRILLTFNKFL
jgi:hypothetical protein